MGRKEGVEEIQNDDRFMHGSSFVSFDASAEQAYYVFLQNLKKSKGLCITRHNPEKIQSQYGKQFDIVWMNQKMQSKELMQLIQKNIKEYIKDQKEGTILLERVDYLINVYGFDAFLKFVYGLNEEIMGSNSALVIHANPNALSEQQKHLLAMELKDLPKPAYVENIKLAKDLYDILNFLREQDTKVSFKTICKKFDITKATARKRVYDLNGKNFVVIKKDGRSKIVELTSEGKSVL